MGLPEDPAAGSSSGSSVELSRGEAGKGIAQASYLGLTGAASYTIGLVWLPSPFNVWGQILGAAAFGGALCYLAATARHMFRFGSTRLGVVLSSGVAFGGSLFLYGVGSIVAMQGVPPWFWRALSWLETTALGLGALVVVLVFIHVASVVIGNVRGEPGAGA